MSVDRNEVVRIAGLAHLTFGDDELDRLTDELNRILGHVDMLRTLELGSESDLGVHQRGVASTRSPEAEAPDRLAEGPDGFAPDWRDGFFVVPAPPGVQANPDAS